MPFGSPMTASGAFMLLAVVGLAAARLAFAPDYAASTGEVRTLALEDGSTVRLDADSALDVHYSAGERGVTLRRGRAAFVVRHGDPRPFVVAAGNGTVQDIGTAFQVTRESGGARVAVAVTAGSVLIRNAYGSAKASAGESVDYGDAGRGPQSTHLDISAATAWQRERLVFDDAPLSDVAEVLNRYYPGHYVFVREEAAQIRVSGNFDIHAPGQAVDTLAETLHLRTTRIAGRIIVLDAPAAS
jgi:transmembrane sensor